MLINLEKMKTLSESSVWLALMLKEFGVVFDTGSGNIVRRLSLSGSSMILLFFFNSF